MYALDSGCGSLKLTSLAKPAFYEVSSCFSKCEDLRGLPTTVCKSYGIFCRKNTDSTHFEIDYGL
jgi:hypothetical protein